MRILLITDEEWNDFVYGNNVLTNWFQGFNAEFAQIYCSPGLPNNQICKWYFRITDAEMVKSLFPLKQAGSVVSLPQTIEEDCQSRQNAQRVGIYAKMKQLSLRYPNLVMITRDLIWQLGRYNKKSLCQFVCNFHPDIVFCPRYATPKLLRLERYIHSICDAPFIAFTADDEASNRQVNASLLYWFRRRYCQRALKRTMPIYEHYYMFSQTQADEYIKDYGIEASTLYKCGTFPVTYISKEVGEPIRLVYAGRLYCNRWRSLAAIGKALKIINKDSIRMVLDIYSQEVLSEKQQKALSKENYVYFKGAVYASELPQIYREADIALHVESFDEVYKLATRVSFSTKIIDLMASTCAILAICWNQHAGYQYLYANDAAICVDSYEKILPTLQRIAEHPSLIREYAEKAYRCGVSHHSKNIIQQQIRDEFQSYIDEFRYYEGL